MRRSLFTCASIIVLAQAGCGTSDASAPTTGSDASDAASDVTSDAASDVTSDAPGDATNDAASDAIDDAAGGAAGAPSASPAPVFDGTTGYVEIPDADGFSQPATGALTVEAWMRPDSIAMAAREGSGYVHWLGKGVSGQQEWALRMYQQGNSEGRDNRISFYAFNLSGGLGAGSYFQDPVTPGVWIHCVGEIDATQTHVFKDGVLRDSDPLSGYAITPQNGTAPVRIGTRDFASFFQGSIARVAIYGAALDAATVLAHYSARAAGNYDQVVLAESSLVAFYKLDETSGTIAHDARGAHDGAYHAGVALGATTW